MTPIPTSPLAAALAAALLAERRRVARATLTTEERNQA